METIRDVIRNHRHFIIAGHVSPDGDAVGACLGLAKALTNMGKQAQVLLEPYSMKFDIIPGKQFLCMGLPSDLQPEVFIALDCGDAARLGAAKDVFNRAAVTVCIDHHGTNAGFARYNEIDGDASSTCEMIYTLLAGLTELDKDIASALYAGMVYDTGGLRYSSVEPETMEIIGKLIAQGIPFTDIYNELLYTHRFNAAKILGRALDEAKLRYHNQIVYTCITAAMLNEAGANSSDLDGVVEYLLNINGVKAAILLYERDKPQEVKVSFRSKRISIDKIALSLGGGGHQYAAGATMYGSIEQIAEQVLAMLEDELTRSITHA